MLEIKLSDIIADEEFNCRGKFSATDVIDLVQDIEKNGLISPIIVKKEGDKYFLIAGFRRYKAFKVLGRETIPCIVREDLTEEKSKTLNLRENLNRKNLNILQEAKALVYYRKKGFTEKEIADELGQSLSWVQVRLMLLKLPEQIQNEAAAGMLTQPQIRQMAYLTPEKQFEFTRKIKDKKLRGEKIIIEPKKNFNPNIAKQRTKPEIERFIERYSSMLGMDFVTRALAWCAGNINTVELERDLQEQCNKLGKKYENYLF